MEGTGSGRGSTATTTAVKHFPSTPRIAQPPHYQTVPAPTPPARYLAHTARRRPRPSDRSVSPAATPIDNRHPHPPAPHHNLVLALSTITRSPFPTSPHRQ
ncbi:unnamed protein product [Macrosiphum euphorbiae]|uniref:Uncharacterized protein n=1 Tax=Macrosiphum euphorbiae TaxID=13131 RepID=A0AAV0WBM1_9HEMI|nr:unnamed protein product [Macrosiphum euphorbiae]